MRAFSKRSAMLGAAALAIAACGIFATPGGAIVGGTFDGDGHPNVAYLQAYDASGGVLFFCTGTLISPTVIVTAAHCTDGAIASMKATFDPDLTDGYTLLAVSAWHHHPSYTQPTKNGSAQFIKAQDYDVGVVILAEPAAGVSPAPIVAPGGLDALTATKKSSVFTLVGYGVERETDPPRNVSFVYSFKRNTTTSGFRKLTPTQLWLNTNFNDAHNGGGICFGDSGGPVFAGSVIVAVNSAGSLHCQSSSLHVRLDTALARAFVSQYVSI